MNYIKFVGDYSSSTPVHGLIVIMFSVSTLSNSILPNSDTPNFESVQFVVLSILTWHRVCPLLVDSIQVLPVLTFLVCASMKMGQQWLFIRALDKYSTL